MTENNKPVVDLVEYYLSRAEIFYTKGKVNEAIQSAETALNLCRSHPHVEREIALKLFIARAKSHQGLYEESNKIYRSLIDEKVYLPPIMLGILHNNLNLKQGEKVKNNVHLMRIWTGWF